VNKFEEYGEELVAVRQDGRLKQLLRIHLGPPELPQTPETGPAPVLTPALFSAYRDLGALRYDFPVVLLEPGAERVAVPLSGLIDRLVDAHAQEGAAGERYRRDLYQLERALKDLAAGGEDRSLKALWIEAANRCYAQTSDEGRRKQLRNNLQSARSELTEDGIVACCDGQITRRFFIHAWQRIQTEQDLHARETLDELIAELTAIVDADRMRSARATSADALRTAMGNEHAGGIDFDRLSSVLRSSKHQRPLKSNRRKRLHSVLKVLEAQRRQLGAGNGKSYRRGGREYTAIDSCVEALQLLDAEMQRIVELFRAVRIARLEVENRYDEARHDAFFAAFDQEQLTPEELRGLPPLFVHIDGHALDAENKSALIEILSSDLPIKIVLELRAIPDTLPLAAGQAGFGGWSTSLGSMATGLRTAFVLQTPASHLPRLESEVAEGLRYKGAALYCVYTGPDEEPESVSRYLRCASAVEGRAFPCFVHHPGYGGEWAQRFELLANPQSEEPWPIHHFSYEDSEGRAMSEEIAFTVVDFLAMDPRFAAQYVPVPPEDWHPNMVPLGDYLALQEGATFGKVPYLLMVNESNTLHRVIVRRGLVAAARRCADLWRSLQELGGIRNSHALRLLEAERQRAIEQSNASHPVTESAADPVAVTDAATGMVEKPPADSTQVFEAAAAQATDQAYIETELCTSCNDCTDRNSMMFAYNEAKQAYIRDAGAGTFRDLVEAAENCPVCIIHPGKPVDPHEPGVEELMRRADTFN
jgi:ferredoxin